MSSGFNCALTPFAAALLRPNDRCADYRALGRLVLREGGRTVALGKVLRVWTE